MPTENININAVTPSTVAALREQYTKRAEAASPQAVILKQSQLVRAEAVGVVFDKVRDSLAEDDRFDVGEILAHLAGWVLFGPRYDPYEDDVE